MSRIYIYLLGSKKKDKVIDARNKKFIEKRICTRCRKVMSQDDKDTCRSCR